MNVGKVIVGVISVLFGVYAFIQFIIMVFLTGAFNMSGDYTWLVALAASISMIVLGILSIIKRDEASKDIEEYYMTVAGACAVIAYGSGGEWFDFVSSYDDLWVFSGVAFVAAILWQFDNDKKVKVDKENEVSSSISIDKIDNKIGNSVETIQAEDKSNNLTHVSENYSSNSESIK